MVAHSSGGGIDEDETLGGGGGRQKRWQKSWQRTASISAMSLLQNCVVYWDILVFDMAWVLPLDFVLDTCLSSG